MNVAHAMVGNRLPVLEVTLEAGDGTEAQRQARAATDYGTASSAAMLFRKRGSATVTSLAGTIAVVASTTIKISRAWEAADAPIASGAEGNWDWWVVLTMPSGKLATFPDAPSTAFPLRVSEQVVAT